MLRPKPWNHTTLGISDASRSDAPPSLGCPGLSGVSTFLELRTIPTTSIPSPSHQDACIVQGDIILMPVQTSRPRYRYRRQVKTLAQEAEIHYAVIVRIKTKNTLDSGRSLFFGSHRERRSLGLGMDGGIFHRYWPRRQHDRKIPSKTSKAVTKVTLRVYTRRPLAPRRPPCSMPTTSLRLILSAPLRHTHSGTKTKGDISKPGIPDITIGYCGCTRE